MNKLIAIISSASLIAAASLLPSAVKADEVKVPVSQQGGNVQTPKKGISKAEVEKRFGTPSTVNGPVGEPPITKWVYNNFTVYFEYDHVIHSVVHNS